MNITADARFVVAAFVDGTIRWYTFDQGQEVLALFIDKDLKRWIAWNPDGFFTYRNDGDALIGYQINRGKGQADEFVKVDQLREVFYRPDLIAQILSPAGTEALIAARTRIGDSVSRIISAGLPPEIELVSLVQADVTDEYVLQFRIKDLGGGLGGIVYRVDGVEMDGRTVETPDTGGGIVSRSFRLDTGRHTLTVAAFDRNNKMLGEAKTIRIMSGQR